MAVVLLTLLGLFLPTQLGLHLWPSWSYVYGLRIDYLSPTIYVTDLLLLAVFILSFKTLVSYVRNNLKIFILSLIFIFLNVVLSASPFVALIAWLRVCLLLSLVLWLKIQSTDRLRYLFLGLAAGIIISASLALSQFALQSSINGIFYWMGERRFDISTPGIARLYFFGRTLLRSYATFGHPNALGGFALLTFLILSNLRKRQKLLLNLALPFAFLAIFLSFSKAALFTLALLLVFRAIRLKPKSTLVITLLLSLIITMVPLFFISLVFGRSLIDRNFLISQSLQIIKSSPIVGVGLNNFIPSQGQLGLGLQGAFIYLQPVHNLFLLLLSEIGMVGIVPLLAFLRRLPPTGYFLLAPIFLLGSIDHYWLTLQQPRLLLAVLFGLILNRGASSILKS